MFASRCLRRLRRPMGARSFAESHNDFTLALYRQLLPRPGNLVFSPFSIRAALGMTYAGARGETAAQMSEALRISSSDEHAARRLRRDHPAAQRGCGRQITRWPWRTRSGARTAPRSSLNFST